jgi:choline dehydrogenase-like flavoprotein
MGISFHETMQGSLTDRWGAVHPFDFRIKAEATHWRAFNRTGEARLTGIVNAPPWAEKAAVDGVITIRVLPGQGRFIRYEFVFRDADAREYAFFGQKNLSWRKPFTSISELEGTVSHGGEVLARGPVRYDMNDVVRFATSAWIDTSIKAIDLDKLTTDGQPMASPLGARDRALLAAFADAMIEPTDIVPAADERTVQLALEILANMPPGTSTAYAGVLRALDGLARLRHGRAFDALPRDKRVAMLTAMDLTAGPPVAGGLLSPHQIVHLVGMPVRAAHFDRPEYLAAVGAPSFENKTREPDPEWVQRIVTPESMDATTEFECDVVVIGTGAGGGPIAAKLAEKGLAVAILEEGRYIPRREFTGSPLERMRKFWRDAGMTFSMGSPPISIPLGKMVGGTTAINSGTCFRVHDDVLADWRENLGLPDDFTPEAFGAYYQQVEDEMQVAPGDKRVLGKVAEIVAKGADAMGLDDHGPLPRNAPGCDGQGACVIGCPTDAKRSSNVSWVPRALLAGAGLYTGLPVTRLLMRGREAVGVEARGVDQFGAPKLLRVRARAVVVACGSLITPVMLMNNGFDLPMLGKNLSCHPALGMWAMTDQKVDGWNAIPQSYGISNLEAEGIKYEGFFVAPQIAGATIPLTGAELSRWMGAQDRLVQYGFMVRDGGDGSVHRGVDGRPIVRYDLSERSIQRLRKGASILAELLLKGGVSEVLTGIRREPTITTVDQARALANKRFTALDFNLLGSHPLGTARIGADPRTAVCDTEHRVFGTDNLYVVDGSSVPTSLGVNPQMTIMALALRAADGMASRL